jgi:CRISPR system Cascade subunit CasD
VTTTPLRRWLILRLEAPLMAFGAVAIDHRGVTWDFPAQSMLTGLFANALGWRRTDSEAHQALQNRIVFAARREREPYQGVFRDTQNARLYQNDEGWTTRGIVEGRKTSGSFGQVDKTLSAEQQKQRGKFQTHQRQRDYHPDALVCVALTLTDPASQLESLPTPTLDDLAAALDRPARPIFIGRKPCLPSAPLRLCFIEASTAHAALTALTRQDANGPAMLRALWPANEGPTTGTDIDRTVNLPDRRNWISGLHGGTRLVVEGRITPQPSSPPGKDAAP